MEATVVDGNGTETGHIIVTTIGGRNGQPKQVRLLSFLVAFCCILSCMLIDTLEAEPVVSFLGVMFELVSGWRDLLEISF